MKRLAYFVIALSVTLTACTQKEAVPPAAEEAAAPVAEAPAEEQMGTAAFIEHMHHHASQLGQLNAALDVGSLAAAQRPAYWLSGHEEIGGVPEAWQVHINGMREGADAVDSARDIEEARAGARTIESSCRGCHAAAGIEVADLQME